MTDENLPEVVVHQTTALAMPLAEFEGEMVRTMIGKLPALDLEMEYGYPRGTHLKFEVEVRVRNIAVNEIERGKMKGELVREHKFAIEEVRFVGVYSPDQADQGVGGGLAATGNDIEDEEQDNDGAEQPDGGPDDGGIDPEVGF